MCFIAVLELSFNSSITTANFVCLRKKFSFTNRQYRPLLCFLTMFPPHHHFFLYTSTRAFLHCFCFHVSQHVFVDKASLHQVIFVRMIRPTCFMFQTISCLWLFVLLLQPTRRFFSLTYFKTSFFILFQLLLAYKGNTLFWLVMCYLVIKS